MALTVNVLRQTKLMGARFTVAEIVFDNSYVTGGEALLPEQLGLTTIDVIMPSFNAGYTADYDYVNKKLLAYKGDGTQEVNATNLAAIKFRVMAVGL